VRRHAAEVIRMQGNTGDAAGVSQHVPQAYVYEPAFGRLFRILSLTPSRVAGVAIATAILGYLAPLAHPQALGVVMMWAGIPALLFVFDGRRFTYAAVAVVAFFSACLFADSFDRTLVAFVGLGGATVAIVTAHHRVGKDHAFDNFDQFLAVTALAMCWSILGACVGIIHLAGGHGEPITLSGLFVPIAFGLSISAVAIVGDLRRLRWLRRLSAGSLPVYAVKTELEGGESSDLPALMGGIASGALLVVRESMPGLPFRSGWRETPVARVPGDPNRLVRRTAARLFVACLSAAIQLLLGVSALSSP
jgi:hypothetical protein